MRLKALAAAVLLAATFGLSGITPANALIMNAGQSVTVDFDLSGSQVVIDAAAQPLTLTFSFTTSAIDALDDPAGQITSQYLGIGPAPVVVSGYSATGIETTLGDLSLSLGFPTTDLVGSIQFSLTESIDLIGVSFSAQDFFGDQIIPTTALTLPQTADAQISEPGLATIFGLGFAAMAFVRRRQIARS